jgi:hypothetical protein
VIWLFVILIQVQGPDTQIIDLNPEAIVAMRPPRGKDSFGPDVKCLISTADGKFIGVVQTCSTVKQLLEGAPR